MRVIISGGGTGGHIFPALSIANALKRRDQNIEILFVGALGRMEMQRVPAAGYPIKGLPVKGMPRKLSFKIFSFVFNLIKSMHLAAKIIKNFKPDIAIGVGGYASGPLLKKASKMGIPTLIQEQNSYAGVTNKLLSQKAEKICVAYDNMEQFFPKEKIIKTGNPIRKNLKNIEISAEEARAFFKLNPNKKTILLLGGSLGAKTLNNSIISNLNLISENKNIQWIVQVGKLYIKDIESQTKNNKPGNIIFVDFIADMSMAYKAADLIISRAGAGTISELCFLEKPTIFVPSPNVAEDHQTKNAMALVSKEAGIMIKDSEASNKLVQAALDTINDTEKCISLSKKIKAEAINDSDERIVNEILKIINTHKP